MTLAELGELLREERVRRGYSVEEVASRLKITSRMVRAIEEGDVSSLPHAVYARGFIRSYASLVDMDEELIRPALQNLEDPQETHNVPEGPIVPPSSRRSGRILPFIIILCCCLGFAVYWHYRGSAANDTARTENGIPVRAVPVLETPASVAPEAPASVPVPAVPPANAAPSVNATDSNATQPASSTAAVSSGASVDSAAVSGSGRQENEPVRTSGFSTPLANATAAEHPTLTLQDGVTQTDVTNAGKGKHQIILSAQQECWVHSSADGTDTRQFSLKKGEVFALSFDRKLTLKLGNAGGVRIKYDGEDLPPPGTPGQVKTLSFPPQN